MHLSNWVCLILLELSNIFLNVEAGIFPWLKQSNFQDGDGLEILQNLQLNRHKRSLPGKQCPGNQTASTTASMAASTPASTPASTNNTLKPSVVVHHYHYYYYCCPGMMKHLHANRNFAHAVDHNLLKLNQGFPPNVSVGMNCGCNTTGACACIPEPAAENKSGGSAKQPQKLKPFDVFDFGVLFDDPINSHLFDFISKNFIKKEDKDQATVECRKPTTPFDFGFDDPICKEFFNFFSNNFMRKFNNIISVTTQTPSALNAATTQVTSSSLSHRSFNKEHIKNTLDKFLAAVEEMNRHFYNPLDKMFER